MPAAPPSSALRELLHDILTRADQANGSPLPPAVHVVIGDGVGRACALALQPHDASPEAATAPTVNDLVVAAMALLRGEGSSYSLQLALVEASDRLGDKDGALFAQVDDAMGVSSRHLTRRAAIAWCESFLASDHQRPGESEAATILRQAAQLDRLRGDLLDQTRSYKAGVEAGRSTRHFVPAVSINVPKRQTGEGRESFEARVRLEVLEALHALANLPDEMFDAQGRLNEPPAAPKAPLAYPKINMGLRPAPSPCFDGQSFFDTDTAASRDGKG